MGRHGVPVKTRYVARLRPRTLGTLTRAQSLSLLTSIPNTDTDSRQEGGSHVSAPAPHTRDGDGVCAESLSVLQRETGHRLECHHDSWRDSTARQKDRRGMRIPPAPPTTHVSGCGRPRWQPREDPAVIRAEEFVFASQTAHRKIGSNADLYEKMREYQSLPVKLSVFSSCPSSHAIRGLYIA